MNIKFQFVNKSTTLGLVNSQFDSNLAIVSLPDVLTPKKKTKLGNYIHYIEQENLKKYDEIFEAQQKFLEEKKKKLNKKDAITVGDIIKIGYSVLEGDKERIQFYEGLIISISNRGLGKTFILRRTVQKIGVEQIFALHSPKILSIEKKQGSKVRRARLYFIRNLRGKSTRLKVKLTTTSKNLLE